MKREDLIKKLNDELRALKFIKKEDGPDVDLEIEYTIDLLTKIIQDIKTID